MKKRPAGSRTRKFWVPILPMLIIGLGVSQAAGLLRLEDLVALPGGTKQEINKVREQNSGPKSEDQAATKPDPADIKADDVKERTSNHITIVEMIAESETIVRGTVISVTDGIQNNFPYTEVRLKVSEMLRGKDSEEVTFRQFGLLKPRLMPNGYVNLNVTPEGWATYKPDEQVLLFLYKKASITGLQAPVGLAQGKFNIASANAVNQTGNIGLFENVQLDKNILEDRDARLLATSKGPVNAESLVSFVRRAVEDRWIEGGNLKNEK